MMSVQLEGPILLKATYYTGATVLLTLCLVQLECMSSKTVMRCSPDMSVQASQA